MARKRISHHAWIALARAILVTACCGVGTAARAQLFDAPTHLAQPSVWLLSDVSDEGNEEPDVDASEVKVADLAKRLSDLESKYDELSEDNESLESSLKGYATSGHDGATMQISGRIHVDVWGFPDDSPGVNGFESGNPNISPQDRFGFRRARLGASGDLPENMIYKIELEFAGGNNVEFRDLYFGWEELPVLRTLLIGNHKRPYGLDHLNSSRYNVFLERPFVIEGFNQDSRRFGVTSNGVSSDQAWNWRYGVFNQRLIQDEGNYISDDWQGQIAGRLANTFFYDSCNDGRSYGHWAIAGTWADTDPDAPTDNFAGSGQSEAQFRTRPEARTEERWLDTGVIAGATDYTLIGTEGVLNFGPVQVVSEYQHVWLDRDAATQLHFHGAYAYVSYFLTGEHMPWNRKTGTLGRIVPTENFYLVDKCRDGARAGKGAWQVAARWSYADFADQDVLGGIGTSATLGLNWYWTPYARMQLNYLYGDIQANDLNAAVGAPAYGHYQVVGARFMVDY